MNHPVTFEHYATISPMSSLLDEQGEVISIAETIIDVMPLQPIDNEHRLHIVSLKQQQPKTQ